MCSLLGDKPRHILPLRVAIEKIYFWPPCQEKQCLPSAIDICLSHGPVNLINNCILLFALATMKPCMCSNSTHLNSYMWPVATVSVQMQGPVGCGKGCEFTLNKMGSH